MDSPIQQDRVSSVGSQYSQWIAMGVIPIGMSGVVSVDPAGILDVIPIKILGIVVTGLV